MAGSAFLCRQRKSAIQGGQNIQYSLLLAATHEYFPVLSVHPTVQAYCVPSDRHNNMTA